MPSSPGTGNVSKCPVFSAGKQSCNRCHRCQMRENIQMLRNTGSDVVAATESTAFSWFARAQDNRMLS